MKFKIFIKQEIFFIRNIPVVLALGLICIGSQSALAYSDKLKAKLIHHITSRQSGDRKEVEITYLDGHHEVLPLTYDQYKQRENAGFKAYENFNDKPTTAGFNLLDENDKIYVAVRYLATSTNPTSQAQLVSEIGKAYFDSLDRNDKAEVGIGAIQDLSFQCGNEKTEKDCEIRLAERMAAVFRKIAEWNKADLERAACGATNYLAEWNPAKITGELGLSDKFYTNKTKVLLHLMDTSPEFHRFKNFDCEGFMGNYKIYDKLMSAKPYLPSIEARMRKPTVQKKEAEQAVVKSCGTLDTIQKLLEGTDKLFKMDSGTKYLSIHNAFGCSGSITLQKKSAGKYIYEQRNNLYMTTGEPVNFSNDRELIKKVFGEDVLKSPSVQGLLANKKGVDSPVLPAPK